MDWKSLTTKLDPLTGKLDPFFEKVKDAGYKALDFTQKQLQNTPIVLKTLEEYTLLRESKRFILIAYDEDDISAREILLRSPVWSTAAWSDAAELRFVEVAGAPEIVRHLDIMTPLDMHVWYNGTLTFHGTDITSIKKWWETRCYDTSLVPADSISHADNDKRITKTPPNESGKKSETEKLPLPEDPLTEHTTK